MTPDPDRQARDRFGVLVGLRLGGGALMALGLYMWAGGGIAGGYGFGTVLMVAGVLGALVVPQILVRRWRTPR